MSIASLRWLSATCILFLVTSTRAQDKDANPIGLLGGGESWETGYLQSPLIFPDDLRVHSISISGAIGKNKLSLMIDPNRRTFDGFGEEIGRTKIAPQRIEATLKLTRADDPLKQGRKLFELESPKFGGRLFIVLPGSRLIYYDKDNKVESVIGMIHHGRPLKPCHPGCFPAGTMVATPDGARKIETLRAGDIITSLNQAGKSKPMKIASVFTGQSLLIEVETEKGKLITTHKQPLNLRGGDIKAAADLVAGDELLRYDVGKVQSVKVKAVHLANRPATIYNLVLEERATFLADGYLVKSKPPVEK